MPIIKRLQHILKQLGLTESEIACYLVLVQSGPLPVADLAVKVRFSLATIYRVVEALRIQGLVDFVDKSSKNRLLRANSISVLLKKLDKSIQKYSRLYDDVAALKQIFSQGVAPSSFDIKDLPNESLGIEIYEGRDEFLSWYFKLPEFRNQNMLAMGSLDSIYSVLNCDYESVSEQKWIDKSVKNGILKTVVFQKTPVALAIKKHDKKDLRRLKLTDSFVGNTWESIWDKFAVTFVCNEKTPAVVVTRNPFLLQQKKQHFDLLWQSA